MKVLQENKKHRNTQQFNSSYIQMNSNQNIIQRNPIMVLLFKKKLQLTRQVFIILFQKIIQLISLNL